MERRMVKWFIETNDFKIMEVSGIRFSENSLLHNISALRAFIGRPNEYPTPLDLLLAQKKNSIHWKYQAVYKSNIGDIPLEDIINIWEEEWDD